MDEALIGWIVEAVEAGFPVGFSNREGILTIEQVDGAYRYYAAGDANPAGERKTFVEVSEFRAFLASRSAYGVRDSVRRYLLGVGHAAWEAGQLEVARGRFVSVFALEASKAALAHVGLLLVAHAEGDAAALATHRAEIAKEAEASPWLYRPFGIFHDYLEDALTGCYERPRYERLREAWTRLLEIEPGRGELLYGRGFAYEMLKEPAAARDDLRAALSDAELPEAIVEYAEMRLERAEKTLEKEATE